MGEIADMLARLLNRRPPPMPPARGVDPHGFPIDLTRPMLPVDGGFQTEFSVTEQLPDGRWYNVPSIWNGQRLDPRTQWDEIMHHVEAQRAAGWDFPNFDTLEEAEQAAQARSAAIEQFRRKSRMGIDGTLPPRRDEPRQAIPPWIGVRG